MSPIAIGIIHPAFSTLKKAGRFLHLIAALLIVTNAIAYSRDPDVNKLFFWCQLIVAADILIFVFAGRGLIDTSPRFNLFFRLAEALIFTMVCVLLLVSRDWIPGILQFILASGYFYLFYCEKKSYYAEKILFQHLGVNLPGFPSDRFVQWIHIRDLKASPHRIFIETCDQKQYDFELKNPLDAEELAEIHEFCRHYLK